MEEIIYFSINNWDDTGAPDSPVFNKWLSDCNLGKYFCNKEWIAENKLIVVEMGVDMSISFIVSAPKDWVEKNCPEIIGSEFDCTEQYKEGTLETKVIGDEEFYLDPIWWCPIMDYWPERIGKLYTYYWSAYEGEDEKLVEEV